MQETVSPVCACVIRRTTARAKTRIPQRNAGLLSIAVDGSGQETSPTLAASFAFSSLRKQSQKYTSAKRKLIPTTAPVFEIKSINV